MSRWIVQTIGDAYEAWHSIPLQGEGIREFEQRIDRYQDFVKAPHLEVVVNRLLREAQVSKDSHLPPLRFYGTSNGSPVVDVDYGPVLFTDGMTIDLGEAAPGDALITVHIPERDMAGVLKMPWREHGSLTLRPRKNEVDHDIAKRIDAIHCFYSYEISQLMRALGDRPIPVSRMKAGLILVAGDPSIMRRSALPPPAHRIMGALLMWGLKIESLSMVLPQKLLYHPSEHGAAEQGDGGIRTFDAAMTFLEGAHRQYRAYPAVRQTLESYIVPTAVGLWGHDHRLLKGRLLSLGERISALPSVKRISMLKSTYRSWLKKVSK